MADRGNVETLEAAQRRHLVNLADSIRLLCDQAYDALLARRRQGRGCSKISLRDKEWVFRDLLAAAARLVGAGRPEVPQEAYGLAVACAEGLTRVHDATLPWGRRRGAEQKIRASGGPHATLAYRQDDALRIGWGSPGRTGCVDIKGKRVLWQVFTDPATGIVHAMKSFRLDFLGLPGARLPEGFSIPQHWGFRIAARGGPPYDSTAVIWAASIAGVKVREDVGGRRRMWLEVLTRAEADDIKDEVIFLCFP